MVNLYKRYYWVIKDQLMAGCYPGALEPELADLQLANLLDAGIRHIINLMEPHEKTWYGKSLVPYMDQINRLADQRQCSVTFERWPIKDLSVPTPEKMGMILDSIDALLAENRPVYVHCLGGIGRTGTVISCYLIRQGLAKGENVLSVLQDLRNNYADSQRQSPESDEQLEFVKAWRESF